MKKKALTDLKDIERSERMNKERAREILQEWKKGSVKFIQQGGLMEKAMEKDFFEYQQALDIAIESLEREDKKRDH